MVKTLWWYCRRWCEMSNVPCTPEQSAWIRGSYMGKTWMWNPGERTFKAEEMDSLKAPRHKPPSLWSEGVTGEWGRGSLRGGLQDDCRLASESPSFFQVWWKATVGFKKGCHMIWLTFTVHPNSLVEKAPLETHHWAEFPVRIELPVRRQLVSPPKGRSKAVTCLPSSWGGWWAPYPRHPREMQGAVQSNWVHWPSLMQPDIPRRGNAWRMEPPEKTSWKSSPLREGHNLYKMGKCKDTRKLFHWKLFITRT